MRKNIRSMAPPEGFRYQADILPLDEERELVEHIRELPLKEFEFHGYVGKRRTMSFGWHKEKNYFMALDDAEADVFVTTSSEQGEQPGARRRVPPAGNGRVVVLTPGHNLKVWLHPFFQALLQNCLRWCGNEI